MAKVKFPLLAGERIERVYEIDQVMVDHIAKRSRDEYPNEACGVLLEHSEGRTRGYVDAINVAREPHHRFMFDAKSMKKLKKLVDEGYKIEAIWHSHPNGRLSLSLTDVQDAAPAGKPLYPGVVYLVLGLLWVPSTPWMSLVGYLWEDEAFRQVQIQPVGVLEETTTTG